MTTQETAIQPGPVAERFDREGLVVLDARLPAAVVDSLRDAAFALFRRCLARIEAHGLGHLGVGTDDGFAEIVQRAPGRFDLMAGAEEPPFSGPLLDGEAPWSGLVTRVLGPEARAIYRGVLMALPGAAEQAWHADGEHLFPGAPVPLPAHCVNVFVPLVDLEPDNGPTELCPGSHRLGGGVSSLFRQDADLLGRIGFRGKPVIPLLPAGSVMAFDYRLVHRAGENRSAMPRPVLYVTYARPWFRDVRSFPERTLAPAPAERAG